MSFAIQEYCRELQDGFAGKQVREATRTQLIEFSLRKLLDAGFRNARFYEAVYNVPRRQNILALSASLGPTSSLLSVGYTINFDDSTFAQKGGGVHCVLDSYAEAQSAGRIFPWLEDLHLRDKSWVDIPLFHGDQMVALIACDWLGSPSDLSEKEQSLLDISGTLIDARLNLVPTQALEVARARLQHGVAECDDINQILTRFLDIVCTQFDIAIAAAFLYEWEGNRLLKILERSHPTITPRVHDFHESYLVGECLSGEAWANDDYRYLVNFQSLLEVEKERHKVFLPSLYRHTAVLTKVTSALYTTVGKREQQYLLRFMNRADDPRLPILPLHRLMIEKLSADLADIVDDAFSTRRHRNVQQLSKAIVQSLGQPRDIIISVAEYLRDEGLKDLAVLSDSRQGTYFTHRFLVGKAFGGQPLAPALWKDDAFYVTATAAGEPRLLRDRWF